jgi:hypothetical protein
MEVRSLVVRSIALKLARLVESPSSTSRGIAKVAMRSRW